MEEDFKEFYIAKDIKRQLLKTKIVVKEADQDRVFLITGKEGSGKSLLAMQLAYFIDRNFSLDDMAFTAEQFKKLVRETKNKVVVFDEAFNGLSSKGALSKQNRELIRLLIECRQRNLFIFIVLPSIFILERYVAIFRSHALFHVSISKKDYKNRFYKLYNDYNKQMLYIKGKQYMSYFYPRINLMHRFYGKYPSTITKEDYQRKKLESFREDEDKKELTNSEIRYHTQRDNLFCYLKEKFGIGAAELSRVMEEYGCPIQRPTIHKIITRKPLKVQVS